MSEKSKYWNTQPFIKDVISLEQLKLYQITMLLLDYINHYEYCLVENWIKYYEKSHYNLERSDDLIKYINSLTKENIIKLLEKE